MMITLRTSLRSKFIRTASAFGVAVALLGAINLLLWGGISRVDAATAHANLLNSRDRQTVQLTQAITIIYSQPPSGTMFRQSSQIGYDPFASDYDQYVWDDFTLSATYVITEIDWRGAYQANGLYGAITDFVVSMYSSTAFGWQPDVLNPPLVQFTAGNNAGEYPPWISGQPIMTIHDYQFALPTPFTAEVGIKYWLQIEGIQPGPTDWGVVGGANGSGVIFYAIPGIGDFRYFRAPGDMAFTLFGPAIIHYWVYLPLVLK